MTVEAFKKFDPVPDYIVHEAELSAYIAAAYGRPFRWGQLYGEHHGQDSYVEFDVALDQDGEWRTDAVLEIERWQQAWDRRPKDEILVELAAEREDIDEHGYLFDYLLWDLARQGLIPTGNYLMKVWW